MIMARRTFLKTPEDFSGPKAISAIQFLSICDEVFSPKINQRKVSGVDLRFYCLAVVAYLCFYCLQFIKFDFVTGGQVKKSKLLFWNFDFVSLI